MTNLTKDRKVAVVTQAKDCSPEVIDQALGITDVLMTGTKQRELFEEMNKLPSAQWHNDYFILNKGEVTERMGNGFGGNGNPLWNNTAIRLE